MAELSPAELLVIRPVRGMPELRPGDDLAGAILAAEPDLRDGDILVVTSKAVSKVEGRLVPAAGDREQTRRRAIETETVRVVARRGELTIAQNRNGLVMAGAGVDASNVEQDEIALLPLDSDASARDLREQIRVRAGVEVGVVVTDSFGRPWRAGITDVAIGAAGVSPLLDHRGRVDRFGNELAVTEVAVADEIAAAADLVKGKLAGVPVAVVRGMGPLVDDPRGASALVRDADQDMFSLGTAEAEHRGRMAGFDAGRRGMRPAVAEPQPERPGPLHTSAVWTLTTMSVRDEAERALREAYLGLLAARPDAMWRSCEPGHLTASALVTNADVSKILLTLHPRVGRWVQLGGHCEPDDLTLRDAAAREALEESGIPGLELSTEPIELHVHALTCSLGVPTRHFDVRFVAVAPPGAVAVRSKESLELEWFDGDHLPIGVSAELPALIRAARARLGFA